MAALSVATPDLNATAASVVHDAISSNTTPYHRHVQAGATAADTQKQSSQIEPSVH